MKKMSELRENSHLQCRDLHHAWKWENDGFVPVKGEGSRKVVSLQRILLCIRCGTRRYDEYTLPDMQMLKSSYEYVEGYQMHNTGKGRVRVAEIRHEIYRRLREKAKA
jgi:hypothetical protein